MSLFDMTKGILGMNARNNLYLRPFNQAKAVHLADSKLQTKQFLSARGIPVPKLYSVIDKESEVKHFNFKQLPENVVLKPNMGFGGGGIIPFQARDSENLIKMSGEKLSFEAVKEHMMDILAGRFSISGAPDTVFFEQRIVCHPDLERFSYKGLPDIRIIVHQLVPVMAMLRLPSKESDGRANLSQGAYGVGIDIGRGICTHTVYKGKIIPEIIGVGPIKGFRIPFWDDILYIASSIQKSTNLGYMAVDIALDKSGPMLLEINARPGLSIQVANMAPLKSRLDRIRGLKIQTPEKGVRIAKELFGQKIEKIVQEETGKQVLGLKEKFEILRKNEKHTVMAKLDPWRRESQIQKSFAEQHGLKIQEDGQHVKIKGILGNDRFVSLFQLSDDLSDEYPVLIGKRDLKNILIDPSKNNEVKVQLPKLTPVSETDWKPVTSYDYQDLFLKLQKLQEPLNLLHYLNPINIEAQKKLFFKGKIENPDFRYRAQPFDAYILEKEVHALATMLRQDTEGLVLKKHLDVLLKKIEFLRAIHSPSFQEKALSLYGAISPEAMALLEKRPVIQEISTKKILGEKEIISFVEELLAKYELKDWSIFMTDTIVGTFSVSNKKKMIFVKKGLRIRKDHLDLSLAHEIEAHILVACNGSKQDFPLLEFGLGNYLKTQEGLAVLTQFLCAEVNQEKHFTFLNLAHYQSLAETMDFRSLYEQMKKDKKLPEAKNSSKIFATCTRLKRGLPSQAVSGTNYKSGLYLQGFYEIIQAHKTGFDIKNLYCGKFDLADWDLIQKLDLNRTELKIPSYLEDSSTISQRLSWIDSSN